MAKVRFAPTDSKSRRHFTVEDCDIGDIIYIEDHHMLALIIDRDIEESKVAYLDDGDTDYYNNKTLCRKFVGEINFNGKDFEEFV